MPAGEVWYILNMWMARRPDAQADLFHRVADIQDAFQVTEGFTLSAGDAPPGTSSFVLYARPSLVQTADERYRLDPKGLYFDRRAALRELPIETISVSRPQGTPFEALSKAFVSKDVTRAIARQWECHDGSWLALIGPRGNIINTQNERSDNIRSESRAACSFPSKPRCSMESGWPRF